MKHFTLALAVFAALTAAADYGTNRLGSLRSSSVVVTNIPDWAKAATAPESMHTTGVVYNASAAAGEKLRTVSGTTITAADVGAVRTNGLGSVYIDLDAVSAVDYDSAAIGQNFSASGYGHTGMVSHNGEKYIIVGSFVKTANGWDSDTEDAKPQKIGASGVLSVAVGNEVSAIGDYSTARGKKVAAAQDGSAAFGAATAALGQYSFASGNHTYAIGNQSHAEGGSNVANGYTAHVEGHLNAAIGRTSHAAGEYASAKDDYSWVWQGVDDYVVYSSHGKGTFNIRPIGGIKGLYIDGKNLEEIISEQIASGATLLKSSSSELDADLNVSDTSYSDWVNPEPTSPEINQVHSFIAGYDGTLGRWTVTNETWNGVYWYKSTNIVTCVGVGSTDKYALELELPSGETATRTVARTLATRLVTTNTIARLGRSGVVQPDEESVSVDDNGVISVSGSLTNGFVVGMSTAWTNGVAAVVTNDVGAMWYVVGSFEGHRNLQQPIFYTNELGNAWWEVTYEWNYYGDWEWLTECTYYETSQDALELEFTDSAITFTLKREYAGTANALGLAYNRDLPALTNGLPEAIAGKLPLSATNGFVVGMSTAWTNGVADVVTNDVGGAWTTGRSYYGGEGYALTNTAVRWNGGRWEVYVEGTWEGYPLIGGWHVGAVYNPEDSSPYEITNTNPNSVRVTTLKLAFDGSVSAAIYADRSLPYNALGLAYNRDLPALTNGVLHLTGGTMSGGIDLYNGSGTSPRLNFKAQYGEQITTKSIYADDIGMYLDGVYGLYMRNCSDWSGITRMGGDSLQTDLDGKVSSFSAVGGVYPTVSMGVANLSTLFTSENTSLTNTIVQVAGSGGGTDGAAVTNIVDSIFPSNRVFGVDGGLLTAYAVAADGGETNVLWQEARGYEMTNGYQDVEWKTRGIDGTVTTIALTDETAPAGVSIDLPAAWKTESRDFCVYVFNGSTNAAPLYLPSTVNIYGYSTTATNALDGSSVTGLYFTEISRGTFLLGRADLVKVQEAAQ